MTSGADDDAPRTSLEKAARPDAAEVEVTTAAPVPAPDASVVTAVETTAVDVPVLEPAPTALADQDTARPASPAPVAAPSMLGLDAPSSPARTIERAPETETIASPSSSTARRPPPVDTGLTLASGHDLEPLSPSARHAPDSPTTSLISSLRQQLELLSEQAQQLNTKLVASISRHADLEDQIFALQDEKSRTTTHVAELERAKAQWEESMNTGLLVERDQITAEMQRLAAGLVEEERKRGTAEERRAQVENEVDDLAAQLFDQANTMVATERMGRAQAEERLKETEENLAVAEAAMRDMQQHLQTLTTEAPSPVKAGPAPLPRRFLSSHPPYSEFIIFLQHLRAARPHSARGRELYPAPAVPTLLAQPFLARCITEDHEPALRLDAAPDLGWVSRRAVGAAIIAGDLLIEPVTAASLGPADSISCALCGKHVFGGSGNSHTSRGFSLNKISLFSSPTAGPHGPVTHSNVYVFRTAGEHDKTYPLCRNGWCLERLRAACALWHFVRTGIVVPVWNSEDVHHSREPSVTPSVVPTTPTPTSATSGTSHTSSTTATTPTAEGSPMRLAPTSPPAQPEPRRKSGWMGGWAWSRPATPGDKREPTTPEDEEPRGVKDESLTAAHQPTAPSPLANKIMSVEDEVNDEGRKEDEREQEAREREVEEKGEKEEKAEMVKEEAERAEEKEEMVETVEKSAETPATDQSKPSSEVQADIPEALAPPRSESRASHSGSESFATPEATPELRPTVMGSVNGDTEKVEEKATDGETARDAVDAAEFPDAESPTPTPTPGTPPASAAALPTSPSVPNPSASPRPPRSANRGPPPLPKRAAARTPAAPSPPATPTQASVSAEAKAEGEKSEAVTEKDEAKAETEETATGEASKEMPAEEPKTPTERLTLAVSGTTEGALAEPSPLTLATPTSTEARPVPPPLPPRQRSVPNSPTSVPPPRTPASAPLSSTLRAQQAQGDEPRETPDKTFAVGDAWEVRAWRQVVRLKEDMWRARVGVIDDE